MASSRKASVYKNNKLVGILTQLPNGTFTFEYTEDWLLNTDNPSVSLTIPKNKKVHSSEFLFPFFFNMLSEGVNRQLQSRHLQIDENDYFGLLLKTAQYDTIGAITLKPIEN